MKDYNKVKGALYGVAIGDALGAPLEFMSADQIHRKHGTVREMIGGGWLNVKPGEITDDTQMTIAVAEGIIEAPEDPVPAIGRRFIDWFKSRPKDVGATCSSAIMNAFWIGRDKAPKEKAQWMAASMRTDQNMGGRTAGNGALMRTIYPALFYGVGPEMLKHTIDISKMTHWSDESASCCRTYVQDVCMMTYGYDGPIGYEPTKPAAPTGYVVNSYNVAMEAMYKTGSFEDALVYAVNKGGDADTIGAITGGLAGARYGYDSIPERWINTLDEKVREKLDYLADKAMEGYSPKAKEQ